jgi:NADH:ubiquinone oxidoreductase subunit E
MQPVAPPAMKEAPLPALPTSHFPLPTFEEARAEKPKKAATAKILVCEKSSCWKRGGKQLCEAIAQTLKEKGLEDAVEIKRTGCLKQCKEGPNLVILPDKAKYSQVRPYQVASLLEKHRLS